MARLLRCAEDEREEPHLERDAVERLGPVALMAGAIHVVQQLVHARQGVEDDRAALGLLAEELARDAVLGRGEADLVAALDARRGVVSLDDRLHVCLLYTSPSPRDGLLSRMPSSA